jgi:hypothetical protein
VDRIVSLLSAPAEIAAALDLIHQIVGVSHGAFFILLHRISVACARKNAAAYAELLS